MKKSGGEFVTITVKDCNGRQIYSGKADFNNKAQVENLFVSAGEIVGLDLKSMIKKAREHEQDFFGMKWSPR